MQTRLQSFMESVFNILVGSVLSYVAQVVVFPLYGIHISWEQDVQIVVIFTVLSIARSYVLRRFFNHLHGRNHA